MNVCFREMGPSNLACVDDYEQHALQVLPKNVADYYAGGAGHEFTLKLNCKAFQRFVIFHHKATETRRQSFLYYLIVLPVSYTHLDVYKRQL